MEKHICPNAGTFRCSTWLWLQRRLSTRLSAGPELVFSLTLGKAAAARASCSAAIPHAASALPTVPPLPLASATRDPLAKTATENRRPRLISVSLGGAGRLSGAQLRSCSFTPNRFRRLIPEEMPRPVRAAEHRRGGKCWVYAQGEDGAAAC